MSKKDNNFRRLELRVMRMQKVQKLFDKYTSETEGGVPKYHRDYIIKKIEDEVFIMEDYIYKIVSGQFEHVVQEYQEKKAILLNQSSQTKLELL